MIPIYFRARFFVLQISLLVLVTCGCNKEHTMDVNTSGSKTITVEFPDQSSMQKNADSLVKHIDSCSFIQLETNAQCLIGEIAKTIIHQNRLYILDSYVTNAVYIFDLEGTWISTIAKKGHGPGEYINISDMYIDKANTTLNLVAYANKKIMTFDLEGKKLLEERAFNFSIWNAECFPDGTLTGYTNNRSKAFPSSPRIICFKDKELQTVAYTALPIPAGWESSGLGLESVFSVHDSSIYYLEPIQNKIYQIRRDSIKLVYTFDFKSLNPDPKLTFEGLQKIDPSKRGDKILEIDGFSPLPNGFVVELEYNGRSKLVFVTNNGQKAEPYLLDDNPLLKPFRFGFSVSLADGVLITQLSPNYVQKKIKRDDYSPKYPESAKITQRDIRKPILEDDNPILCIYHLK